MDCDSSIVLFAKANYRDILRITRKNTRGGGVTRALVGVVDVRANRAKIHGDCFNGGGGRTIRFSVLGESSEMAAREAKEIRNCC